jgi:hypothetical protein
MEFEKWNKLAGMTIFGEYQYLGKSYVKIITHFQGKKLSELLLSISKKFPEAAKEITVRIMMNNPGRLAGYLN